MLGRVLGEVTQAVAAAEVDGEELSRINVLAADRAFFVEGDLLHFRFLYFLLLLLLRLDLGQFKAKVDVDVRQRLAQLGSALLGDAALPRIHLAQELHVLEAGQPGIGHLGVVEVERHQVRESLDMLQTRVINRCVSQAELGQVVSFADVL